MMDRLKKKRQYFTSGEIFLFKTIKNEQRFYIVLNFWPMKPISPWLLNTNAALSEAGLKPLFESAANGYGFKIFDLQDSCYGLQSR